MFDNLLVFLNLKSKYSTNKLIYILKENRVTRQFFKTTNYDDKLIFSILNVPLFIFMKTIILYFLVILFLILPLLLMNVFTFELVVQSILLLTLAYAISKNEILKITELENYAINVIRFDKSLYLKLNYILKTIIKSIVIMCTICLINDIYNVYYFSLDFKSYLYIFLYFIGILSLLNFPVKMHLSSFKCSKIFSAFILICTYILILLNISLKMQQIEFILILTTVLNLYFYYYLLKTDLSNVNCDLDVVKSSTNSDNLPLFLSNRKGNEKYEELFFERNKKEIKIFRIEYLVYIFLFIILYLLFTTSSLTYAVLVSVQFETFAWIMILLIINKTNAVTKYYYKLSDKYLINYSFYNKNILPSFNVRLKENLSLNLKASMLISCLICIIYFFAAGRVIFIDFLLVFSNFSIITFIITYYNLVIYYLFMDGLNIKSSKIKYCFFKYVPFYIAYNIMGFTVTLLDAFILLTLFSFILFIVVKILFKSRLMKSR